MLVEKEAPRGNADAVLALLGGRKRKAPVLARVALPDDPHGLCVGFHKRFPGDAVVLESIAFSSLRFDECKLRIPLETPHQQGIAPLEGLRKLDPVRVQAGLLSRRRFEPVAGGTRQGLFSRCHVLAELDLGEIQRLADFVESAALSVGWEHFKNLEVREFEQVAQSVLVFSAR